MGFLLGMAMLIPALAAIQTAKRPPLVSRFERIARQDSADTLPPYLNVRGNTRDSTKQIEAAIDALHGRVTLAAPLKLRSYRRSGSTVVIDMVADTLPRLRWSGAGGAIQILADGRRVILRRHD